MSTPSQTLTKAPSGTPGHHILGTAGHIDHGKTSLIRALTGTNTDRLPEERRRGMTIELGFAELTIGALRFGIVDVPGHERFVRTMVAGATGIDIALLVVAADDSVMPQTIEHVEVLHLLGISRVVVAITKIDMVEPDMVELVVEEVRELLDGTPMAGAPMHPVSSTTGAGLSELRAALVTAAQFVKRRPTTTPFRLAVDRVFSVQGRGTVVTGSVLRGSVSEGDTLEVWPAGDTCRVRGLQSHGAASSTIARGQRAAVNISGLNRDRIDRGCELATPGYLQPSRIADVRLRVLGSYAHALKSSSVARLEIGTTELPVRIVFMDGEPVAPGESTYAQLRAGEPFTTAYGQRFILRDGNAARTIGGGIVLRPIARRKRRGADASASLQRLEKGDAADRVEEVLRSAGFVTPTDWQLCARAGVEPGDIAGTLEQLKKERRWEPIGGTEVCVVPGAIDDLGRRLVGWLERHHRRHPELPGRPADAVLGWLDRMTGRSLARPLFEVYVLRKTIKRLGRFVCLPAFAPSLSAADEKIMAAMIEGIRTGGFQPPAIETFVGGGGVAADRKRAERLATLAVALGELIPIESKLYIHTETQQRMQEVVAELIRKEGGATVAQIREALQSSRKFVVPFVEYLDRIGFTNRSGDVRVLVDADDRNECP